MPYLSMNNAHEQLRHSGELQMNGEAMITLRIPGTISLHAMRAAAFVKGVRQPELPGPRQASSSCRVASTAGNDSRIGFT